MTDIEKNLLKIDLCCRLPYNVKVHAKYTDLGETIELDGIVKMIDTDGFVGIQVMYDISSSFICVDIDNVKPYLFPLSSMSEEQRKEFLEISHLENRSFYNGEKEIEIVSNEVWTFDLGGDADTEYRSIDIKRIRETVKWLNKNHFDWRGLIPMGLVEDATNKNIY